MLSQDRAVLRRSAAGAAMLALAVLLAQLAAAGAQSPQAPPTADALLNAAKRTADASDRNILVEFSASWCGWCRRFDAFVNSADVGPLMQQHFVIVTFIVQESPDKRALNTPGGQNFMDAWGGGRSGLPFYAFLTAGGDPIATSNAMPTGANIGYPATSAEIDAFVKLLEQVAPRMTADERARIAQYFRSST